MQKITNHPLIVLIVVIVITLALAYISVFQPKFALPSLPASNTTQPTPAIQTNTAHSIVAASQRLDYQLQLTDQKGVSNMFSDLNVWDKTYKGKDAIPLNTTIIFLTNKPQPITQKDPAGNLAFSYSLQYERDAVAIAIYLPDSTLTGPAPSAFFGASVALIASQIGGSNKTIPQIPNNNLISGFFKILPAGSK